MMKGIGVQILAFVALLASWATAALSSNDLNEILKDGGKSKTLKLTNENVDTILEGKRDFHVILMMSSSSVQFNCPLCNEVRPEFEILANSWFREHPDGVKQSDSDDSEEQKNVFFVYAEFIGAQEVFKSFSLKNIPKIFYIPPTTNPKTLSYLLDLEEYQFYAGDHKQLIAGWILETIGYKINIYVPPNYNRIATIAFSTFVFVSLIKRYSSYVSKVVTSPALWTGFSLVLVVLLTSGYMFNQIRGVPYLKEYPDGRVDYFTVGQQSQYGIETQIVSFIYGILSVLFILLVKGVPNVKNPSVNLIAVGIVCMFIFVFYSLLLTVFDMKGMGYPYSFLRFGF